MPFAYEDRISLVHKECRQIVKGISQRFRLAIFELAQNHSWLHFIPRQAADNHQIVAFGIDLQKIDFRKPVFLHNMTESRHGYLRRLLVAVSKSRQRADT